VLLLLLLPSLSDLRLALPAAQALLLLLLAPGRPRQPELLVLVQAVVFAASLLLLLPAVPSV
jgi:hypothetical protein